MSWRRYSFAVVIKNSTVKFREPSSMSSPNPEASGWAGEGAERQDCGQPFDSLPRWPSAPLGTRALPLRGPW
jgi:hypothetical protein